MLKLEDALLYDVLYYHMLQQHAPCELGWRPVSMNPDPNRSPTLKLRRWWVISRKKTHGIEGGYASMFMHNDWNDYIYTPLPLAKTHRNSFRRDVFSTLTHEKYSFVLEVGGCLSNNDGKRNPPTKKAFVSLNYSWS